MSASFRASDGPEAFKAALEERSYQLAQGDRRDFVVIDPAGGIHSLARRIDSMKAADLRDYMAPLDRATLPSAEDASAAAKELWRQAREAGDEAALETSYSRGGDYVSQSRAAQKEHERRQAALDNVNNQDSAWERIEAGEARRERSSEQHPPAQQREHQGEAGVDAPTQNLREANERDRRDSSHANREDAHPESSRDAVEGRGDIEITDAMQARLDRLREARQGYSSGPGGPSRQDGAPGGGRPRSR